MNLEELTKLTDMKVVTKPYWIVSDDESSFESTLFRIDESILLVSSTGTIGEKEMTKKIQCLNSVIDELSISIQDCIIIEDMSEISEVTLEARQVFGQWLTAIPETFKLYIFNKPDSTIETTLRFRMSIHPKFGTWAWITKDIEEAFELVEKCKSDSLSSPLVSGDTTVPENRMHIANLLGYLGNLVWLGNMEKTLPEFKGDEAWDVLYSSVKVLRDDIKEMLLHKNKEVSDLEINVKDRTRELEIALLRSRTAEEKQHELALDLAQMRKYSDDRLKETRALLDGLDILNSSLDSGDPFKGLMAILEKNLDFEHLFFLVLDAEGNCTTNFNSDKMFMELKWKPGVFFGRLKEGKAISVFDTALIPEWQNQPAEILSECVSALHIPQDIPGGFGILICTSSRRGSFSRADADFAQHLSVLASQAIRNADLLRKLQSEQVYLEEMVKERTREVRNLARFATENPNPMMRVSGEGILLYANEGSSDIIKDWDTEVGKEVPQFMRYLIHRVLDVNEVGITEISYGDNTVQLTLAPIPGEQYVSLYGTDITERKNAQTALEHERAVLEVRVLERTEELRTTNEQLFTAMETKDKFLARMSHELRTPLNAIMGFSESLHDDVYGKLSEKQTEIIANIEMSGGLLLDLINDVLDFSKMQTDKFILNKTTFRIREIAESSIHLIEHISRKKDQELSVEIDDSIYMYADKRRVKQIIVNLLSNAVKFTAEQGEIFLEVRGDRSEGLVYVSVRDTGIGISEQDMDLLFVPFEQIDSSISRKYEGSGLGLDISKKLAELHGGDITVKSELGKGSVFTLHLPWEEDPDKTEETEEEQLEVPEEKPNSETEPDSRMLHILLVEDNEANIQTIRDYLESTGMRVSVATNGIEALSSIDREIPDLILMDVFMPEMDGLEATRIIREERGLVDLPIIALTALAMDSDMEKCLEAGATEYFTKPVRFGKLVKTIHRLAIK